MHFKGTISMRDARLALDHTLSKELVQERVRGSLRGGVCD